MSMRFEAPSFVISPSGDYQGSTLYHAAPRDYSLRGFNNGAEVMSEIKTIAHNALGGNTYIATGFDALNRFAALPHQSIDHFVYVGNSAAEYSVFARLERIFSSDDSGMKIEDIVRNALRGYEEFSQIEEQSKLDHLANSLIMDCNMQRVDGSHFTVSTKSFNRIAKLFKEGRFHFAAADWTDCRQMAALSKRLSSMELRPAVVDICGKKQSLPSWKWGLLKRSVATLLPYHRDSLLIDTPTERRGRLQYLPEGKGVFTAMKDYKLVNSARVACTLLTGVAVILGIAMAIFQANKEETS